MNFKMQNHNVVLKYNVDGKSSNELVGGNGNIFTLTILVEGSNCPEKNIWTEIVKETLTTTQSSSTVMMSWMHLRITGTASLVMSRG